MREILLLIALGGMLNVNAQVIPNERIFEWDKAGLVEEIQEPSTTANIVDFGGVGDGLTNNNTAFTDALNSLNGQAGVIYFPSGTFRFEQRLNLESGVILRGNSSDSTTLEFELDQERDLINLTGNLGSTVFNVEAAERGDTTLILDDASGIEAGDLIQLYDNDTDMVLSVWANYSTGQIISVEEIHEDTLYLASELRRDYLLGDEPKMKLIDPIRDVSIENLKIIRLDTTTGQTSNIEMIYAYNCRVKCVESENCNFAHVTVDFSSNISVTGSYFHHAMAYGGGGQGYGVVLEFTTGECLVENNIFEHLRHSMLMQAGANGNVCGYNYSFDPFWMSTGLPQNSAGDAVLHGNYVYGNLFEGNIVQNIVIDDSHGANGPYNAFFRNRGELYGIFMNNNPASDNQTFIGNEITNSGFLLGNYFLNGTGHYEFGNNHLGTVTPSGTSNLTIETLYKSSAPVWYDNHSSWPPLGYPNSLDQYTIEAKYRHDNGQFTACMESNPVGVAEGEVNQLLVYPNPANDWVNVKCKESIDHIEVVDLQGRQVKRSNTKAFDVSGLPNGAYLIRIFVANGEIHNGSLMISR